jgi:hypothetical protein
VGRNMNVSYENSQTFKITSNNIKEYAPQKIISNNIKVYTHKKHNEEIFVVCMTVICANKSIVKCSFKNNHRHYDDVINVSHLLNPMLILECCRQAETYIAHQRFFFDESMKFILKSWSLNIIKESYKKIHRNNCHSFDIHVETSNAANIKSRLRENKYSFLIKIGEAIIAKAKFNVKYINGICYSNLRGKISDSYHECNKLRLAPRFVGYMSSYNSILSDFEKYDGRYRALINVNFSNITYNDHEQDHVTGMNIVEAAKQFCFYYLSKQLGINDNKYQMIVLKSEYYFYVELSSPSYVYMDEIIKLDNGDYKFILHIIQDNTIKSKCEIQLTRF